MCSVEIRAKVKVIFIIQFSEMLLQRILSVLKTITVQSSTASHGGSVVGKTFIHILKLDFLSIKFLNWNYSKQITKHQSNDSNLWNWHLKWEHISRSFVKSGR